ncbi:MAG: sensor histidine kinase, partial [Deinococcus sp.]
MGSSLQLALERAEGARLLEVQNAELLAANEELDAFAYSASHDLRTPVRHIVGFNQLLQKNLGDDLNPQAARYLKVIGEAATRMNTLIDAMLDLARTSRQPLRLKLLDLGALIGAARSELE